MSLKSIISWSKLFLSSRLSYKIWSWQYYEFGKFRENLIKIFEGYILDRVVKRNHPRPDFLSPSPGDEKPTQKHFLIASFILTTLLSAKIIFLQFLDISDNFELSVKISSSANCFIKLFTKVLSYSKSPMNYSHGTKIFWWLKFYGFYD